MFVSPLPPAATPQGGCVLSAFQTSDATRFSVAGGVFSPLCRVASGVSCRPTTLGGCAVGDIILSLPTRDSGEERLFLVFLFGSREGGAQLAATPRVHHIRVKTQMRLDFLTGGGGTSTCVQSPQESRVTRRRWRGVLLGLRHPRPSEGGEGVQFLVLAVVLAKMC